MKRALLVEDNLLNRRVISSQVKRFGYQIVTRTDGLEALAFLEQEKVDFILMDLHMPGMNGNDCARKIRSSSDNPNQHTPIIAITAHVSDAIRKECEEAGMQAFLGKPVLQEDLYQAISQALKPIPEREET